MTRKKDRSKTVVPRPRYPEWGVRYAWPVPGVRTWTSSAGDGDYVHTGCNGAMDCACACSVGVYKVNGRIYGCGCPGHDARRARLAGPKRLQPSLTGQQRTAVGSGGDVAEQLDRVDAQSAGDPEE